MAAPDYFRMLGKVMSTASFPLGGLVAYAEITQAMRDEIGPTDDDSSDYVGLIRYAAGSVVALFYVKRPKTPPSPRSKSRCGPEMMCRRRPSVWR